MGQPQKPEQHNSRLPPTVRQNPEIPRNFYRKFNRKRRDRNSRRRPFGPQLHDKNASKIPKLMYKLRHQLIR